MTRGSRVIYDDVAMKQKRVLVKRVDTRLISELDRRMTVLARKSVDSDYQDAVVVDSHQTTNNSNEIKDAILHSTMYYATN